MIVISIYTLARYIGCRITLAMNNSIFIYALCTAIGASDCNIVRGTILSVWAWFTYGRCSITCTVRLSIKPRAAYVTRKATVSKIRGMRTKWCEQWPSVYMKGFIIRFYLQKSSVCLDNSFRRRHCCNEWEKHIPTYFTHFYLKVNWAKTSIEALSRYLYWCLNNSKMNLLKHLNLTDCQYIFTPGF
jgi:hypothetical protein